MNNYFLLSYLLLLFFFYHDTPEPLAYDNKEMADSGYIKDKGLVDSNEK